MKSGTSSRTTALSRRSRTKADPAPVASKSNEGGSPSPFGVVILAAGASSRMGRPKMLLPWQDTTIIGHLISLWRSLGAEQIGVVLRPNDTALGAELDRLAFSQAGRIVNPQPERGMFSSIVCAANWTGWQPELARWVIALGDQPHLRTDTLRTFLELAAQNVGTVCQPAFGGRAAHPVILPRPVFAHLKNSPAATLKDFLNLAACRSVQYVISDPGLTLDLDTPEDYIQAKGSIDVA